MAFLLSTAFGLSSSISGMYIYRYHSDHFKETMFNTGVEAYTRAREGYYAVREKIGYPVEDVVPQIEIKDMRLIHPNGDVINLSPNDYKSFDLSRFSSDMLLHVVYQYQDQTYRIVFTPGQDLTVLTTNTDWLENGFHNGIDRIVDENFQGSGLWDLMTQYAGPLADFYDEAGIDQNARGFLSHGLSTPLFSGDNENAAVRIFDILGEDHTFRRSPPEEKSQEVLSAEIDTPEPETEQETEPDTDESEPEVQQGFPPEGYRLQADVAYI